MHGIITHGGDAVNVIPARAEAKFGLRAKDLATLAAMVATFTDVAQGAALETGTTVEITDYLPLYAPVAANVKLGDVVADELRRRGVEAQRGVLVTASTDLGNVSQKVPTDWIPLSPSPSGRSRDTRTRCAMRASATSRTATARWSSSRPSRGAHRVASDASLRRSIQDGATVKA